MYLWKEYFDKKNYLNIKLDIYPQMCPQILWIYKSMSDIRLSTWTLPNSVMLCPSAILSLLLTTLYVYYIMVTFYWPFPYNPLHISPFYRQRDVVEWILSSIPMLIFLLPTSYSKSLCMNNSSVCVSRCLFPKDACIHMALLKLI